MLYEDLIVM